MLEYLRIKNFQKHTKLQIDFAPGITTICGATDTGKSSIIRALRWVLLNDVRGDGFIQWGTKDAAVGVATTDGHTVVRKRGKGGNTYTVDGERLVAFGNGIPEPVQAALRCHPISIQQQRDIAFWFAMSASQIGQELNGIVNLGLIDRSLKRAAGITRTAAGAVKVHTASVAQHTQTKSDLAWVPACAAALDARAAQKQRACQLAFDVGTLATMLKVAAQRIKTRDTVAAALTVAETVQLWGQRASASRDNADTLTKVVSRARGLHQTAPVLAAAAEAYAAVQRTRKVATQHHAAATRLRNLLTGTVCPLCDNPL